MKKHAITVFVVGIAGILLQSCLFICGCSSPAQNADTAPEPGRRLYSAKCGSCHSLLPPQEYTAETWVYYVDKYGRQMTDQEKRQVSDYLTSRAALERREE